MSRTFKFTLLVLGLFWLTVSAQDRQGVLNKLLAPGPLIEGHKQFEGTECLNCHAAGAGVPDSKCLDCHKEIKPYVSEKRGFHGLARETCIQCHSDHKGRNFDSTKLDEEKFDHSKTGYQLKGKHAKIKCVDCHKEKRTKMKVRSTGIHYLGQTASCLSCHEKDDVHYFKNNWAKKDCGTCHGVENWKKDAKFNHEKEAKYKLIGKHAELTCAKCHVPEIKSKISKYKWPQLKTSQCLSCHENFHKNNLQTKFQNGRCDTCHGQATWKVEKFDHKKTGYELKGKHADIKCVDCHKQADKTLQPKDKNFQFKGLKTNCLSCHDDFHLFGGMKSRWFKKPNQCLECHNEASWKQVHYFNHDNQTRYVIDGKHEELKCSQCHTPERHLKPPRASRVGIYFWKELNAKTCENCHKSPHTNIFSKEMLKKKCTECHVTSGWKLNKTGKNFDHSKTRFELTGKHKTLQCNDCHVVGKKQVFTFKSFEQKFCIDCHKNVHEQQFHTKFSSQSCAECHTTKSFTPQLEFDHNKTAYPLVGAHQKLKCIECHTATKLYFTSNSKDLKKSVQHKYLFPNLDKEKCLTCHGDFHQGQLDKDCKTCHSEKKWQEVTFQHNLQSDYKLRGKHQDLKCVLCHKPIANTKTEFYKKTYPLIRYKPLPSECLDCHKDHHNGKFGRRCQECHNETKWKTTRDFHRNFTLSGVHFTLQCAECHTDSRKLSGMSGNCFVCHQKDDIHNGMLPQCGECHRQQFWENAEFKHSMSNFPLRGAHRTLDCIECHSQGIYKGKPSTCIACHIDDALAVSIPEHSPPTTCTNCHNQFTFSR